MNELFIFPVVILMPIIVLPLLMWGAVYFENEYAESEEDAKDKVDDDTEHSFYLIEGGGVFRERICNIEEVGE
jgi:hypothetical protein